MKKLDRYFVLIFFIVSIGCSVNQKIYENLTKKAQELDYVFDSEKKESKRNISVYIDTVFFHSSLPTETSVETTKKKFLPFLIINIVDYDYNCIVGKNSISENINSFFYETLLKECNRSGFFNLTNNSPGANSPDITVSITIDSLSLEGLASQNYIGGAIGATALEMGPGFSLLEANIKLQSNNGSISEHLKKKTLTEFISESGLSNRLAMINIHSSSSDNFPNSSSDNFPNEVSYTYNFNEAPSISTKFKSNFDKNIQLFAVSLATALSNSIKQVNEEIVTFLNDFIINEYSELFTTDEILTYKKKRNEQEKLKKFGPKLEKGYLRFRISGGRYYDGELAKVTEKKVIVINAKKLITIDRSVLVKVENSEGNDVTSISLQSRNFMKLNYNKFSEFINVK